MLKKLLEALRGGGAGDRTPQKSAEAAEPIHYKGYEIIALPDNSGGQYRVSALIRRSEEGHMQEQRFERSDMLPDRDSCIELTRTKVERYIDEQGEQLFNNPHHPS
ncbi:HlyU family transcriptional regulator [Kushneria aurantia]|uniref:HlyU family transcriptional regulator n=1 Tax=Kushneria aurantia TaxID=504092 RepID=A0ABV6G1P1_9GAMM|nr:HlyU family transcriptional regulator [Kushneria aurantia]